MSSCLGFGRKSKGDEDTEALLPQYGDETSLQRTLHQKLHTYQMLRALTSGYMPSTEQVIVNLRTLLASDVLNPDNPDLSDSGRRLLKFSKQWLMQFIELIRHKNDGDQIQDFIWYLTESRISVDTEDLAKNASKIKNKADASAAYESFRTVGGLLMTNSDFRMFLGDLGTIGHQVFADVASTISDVADKAGDELKPSEDQRKALQQPGKEQGSPPTVNDLESDVKDVTKVVGNGLAKTGDTALSSLKANATGIQQETLTFRLKEAVKKLRTRPDYTDSVSTIGLLIKRYALTYSRAADKVISVAQDDVDTNAELDRTIKNLWLLVTSFGNKEYWEDLKSRFEKVMEHSQSDPEFEAFMTDVANSVQKLLTDPEFLESADKSIARLQDKLKEVDNDSTLRKDVSALLAQIPPTFNSVIEDEDISALIATSTKLIDILSPNGAVANKDLLQDSLHVFVPLMIQAIQYVPIPRVEVSVPEIDMLLENLILEPGKTVNNSSFLPYKLLIKTYNDLEISKTHTQRTSTSTTNLVTIAINGLSVRADEIGFWLRAHKGLLYLADEGIASFQLDERGIDIAIDVEIGKEKLEKILTLKKVRVTVHKLDYQLRKSKLSWLAWIFKPFLRPIVRKVLERQLASAIADSLHFANRELLYARERLRATRISDPQDVRTFIKAIITRLTPAEDPDVYTAVGVKPSQGVFKNVYAPGSVVKLWEDEARLANERVEDGEVKPDGWRNEVFDVHTLAMGQ